MSRTGLVAVWQRFCAFLSCRYTEQVRIHHDHLNRNESAGVVFDKNEQIHTYTSSLSPTYRAPLILTIFFVCFFFCVCVCVCIRMQTRHESHLLQQAIHGLFIPFVSLLHDTFSFSSFFLVSTLPDDHFLCGLPCTYLCFPSGP